MQDIEKAIAEYGNKAKKGTLALEDMAGGRFTLVLCAMTLF